MKIRRPYCYLRGCFIKGGVNLKMQSLENIPKFDSYYTCILHNLIKLMMMTFLTIYKGLFEKFSRYLPLYCVSACPT